MGLRIGHLWTLWRHSGPRYRKLTAIAARIIRDLVPPAGAKVRVLFDALYFRPAVTRACPSMGFFFFSVAQRSCNLTIDNHKTRRITKLMPGLVCHRGQNVRIARARA